jgi:hypothetical protein
MFLIVVSLRPAPVLGPTAGVGAPAPPAADDAERLAKVLELDPAQNTELVRLARGAAAGAVDGTLRGSWALYGPRPGPCSARRRSQASTSSRR